MIEKIENAIERLQAEINKNNELINSYDEKTRMAKVNQFEFKLGEILVFSMLPWFILYGLFAILAKNGTMLSIISTIPAASLPYPIFGISLCIGEIVRRIVERKWQTKERLKKFSQAKTQSELLEEEISNAIKLEQARNRNKAIQDAIDELETKKTFFLDAFERMSPTFQHRYIEELTYEISQRNSNVSLQMLEEAYQKLDIYSKQKVLHEYFQKTDARTKLGKAMNTIVYGLYGGLTGMIFLTLPDVMISQLLPATVSQPSIISTLIPVLAPGVVGTAGTIGYMINRNKKYEEVFKKLNKELGENALPDAVDNIDQKVRITTSLSSAKTAVKCALVSIEEQQSIMETHMPNTVVEPTGLFTPIEPMKHGADGPEKSQKLARKYPHS